jgi:hypothetical protein
MDKNTKQTQTEYEIANTVVALVDAVPTYHVEREARIDGRVVDAVIETPGGTTFGLEVKRVGQAGGRDGQLTI